MFSTKAVRSNPWPTSIMQSGTMGAGFSSIPFSHKDDILSVNRCLDDTKVGAYE